MVDIKGLNYPPIDYVMYFSAKKQGLRYIHAGHYCARYEGTFALNYPLFVKRFGITRLC